MLRLVALAPEDGWAFVQSGAEILLARPPYRRPTVVDRHVVARALAQQGFVAEQQDFSDWKALLSHVEQRLVAAREARGKTAADREEILGLLDYAPKPILVGFLDRIAAELIPNREWEPALELLTRMLRLTEVQSDPELHDRTLDLLDRCQKAMVGAERERQALVAAERGLQREFPNAVQKYGPADLSHCTRAIRARRMVFPLTAVA